MPESSGTNDDSLFVEGEPVPMRTLGLRSHPEGCMAKPIYKKDDLSEPVTYIVLCVDGCPQLERTLERGRELAKEYGW